MITRWLVFLMSLLAAAPAAAQVYMPTFQNSTMLLDVYAYSFPTAKTATPPPRSSSDSNASPRDGQAAPANTRYRPSSAVTERVQRRFVAFIGQQSGPAGAREMEKVLATQDPTTSWLAVVGRDGLVPNDLVDAITAYWVLNWNVANQTDSTREQMQGARAQVRRAVAANPALSRLDEAGRQDLAEALVLNFLVQHAAFRDAAQVGDRVLMRRLSDAAVARFRNEAHLDLRGLKLTSRGFTP